MTAAKINRVAFLGDYMPRQCGIATFSNLRLSEAGTYKLKATDGTDAAAISTAFKIS